MHPDIEESAVVSSPIPPAPEGYVVPFVTPSGPARVYVKTFGCVHARNDGEYLAGQLLAAGYRLVERFEDADAVVVYGCTVKNPSEDSCVNLLISAISKGKKAVAAGCVTQADPMMARLPPEVSIVGVRGMHHIVDVTTRALMGQVVRLVPMPPTLASKKLRRKMPTKEQERLIEEYEAAKKEYFSHASASFVPPKEGEDKGTFLMEMPPLDLPKVRRNPLIETLCVGIGCIGVCTFCKTRFARGRLQSYPPEQLIARARQAVTEGVKEIWLTGEDVGAYGVDLPPIVSSAVAGSSHPVSAVDGVATAPAEESRAGCGCGSGPCQGLSGCACAGGQKQQETHWTLPKLVREIAAVIPKDCMIRIGHTNPQHAFRTIDGLAEVLRMPNVYSFLHVPVQAGSDAVLRHMRRPYVIDQFRHVVTTLRREVPDITLATDVICGYSNETEEDFQQTEALVREFRFPVLNITQMYPRPGTPAFDMPRVPSSVVKARSRRLTRACSETEPFVHLVGVRQPALFTEFSECGRFLVGHLKNYVQVLLPGRGVTIDLNSPEFANACIKFPREDDEDDDSIRAAGEAAEDAPEEGHAESKDAAGLTPPTAAAGSDLDFEGGPSVEGGAGATKAATVAAKRAVPKTRQCTVQLPRPQPVPAEQPELGQWVPVHIVKATRYYVFAEREEKV